MQKRFLRLAAIIVVLLCIYLPAETLAIEGLPGSTWGLVNDDYDKNGLTGSGAMGFVNQGINWFVLPGGAILNTYVEYRYRGRDKEKLYYNSYGPALGLELRKSYFTAGIDYYRERFPELKETSNSRSLYGTWYYDWQLERATRRYPTLDFPGSSWGRVQYDLGGLTGSGAMGFINQGIDWFTFSGGIVVNTFVEYRYRGRTKERSFFNANGPAVGLELRKAFLRFGISHYWERFPVLNQSSNTAQLYVTWYYNWDLMR